MNERIKQFLIAENVSQSQFADTIGVAKSSITHILSGRNKPGYDFILSTAKHYPALNLEWLITGKGKMFKNNDLASISSMGSTPEPGEDAVLISMFDNNGEAPASNASDSPAVYSTIARDNKVKVIEKQRKITKITVFYDDGSYEEIVK